ncbi:(Lyso)-N-acylphosphatidylethanolamine lipase [Phyllobates terribilis]|uniref:(Lyso)-N-acylphosphatidylethanolamine lipase n=1 Tax=Phyllobates terribilis TaxID=111132 RepID=UPI003CCB55E7
MPGLQEGDPVMAEQLEERSQSWLTGWIPSWCPTSMSQLKAVESRILQCIRNRFSARYVSLPDQNKIWTLTVSPELRDKTPLVMVHGFGGGVGLWIQNIDHLSTGRTLHAFDLLGFGRSSRPSFPGDPVGAEEQFVSSIEQWRQEMGINDMILLGHSLGGFLATSYSMRFPQRVKHLILVDPWGFPDLPTDPNEVRSPPAWVKALAAVLGRSNPLAVVRAAGPWGPRLVQRFRPDLKRKFEEFFDDDTIMEYIYHCNAQTPSGESAFKTMMERFGWAKRPMMSRLNLIPKDLPITFIYGAETWIDQNTGEKAKMLRPDSYVNTLAIRGASHHVYADQPGVFNSMVEEICDAVD